MESAVHAGRDEVVELVPVVLHVVPIVILHRRQPGLGGPGGEDEPAAGEQLVELGIERRHRDVGQGPVFAENREPVVAALELPLGHRIVGVAVGLDAE